MKPFVATGYNDGSGNPVQAVVTAAAVEAEFDAWLQQQAEFVAVNDIEVIVDSHNRGQPQWNGSCVARLVAHYTEIAPDAVQATAPSEAEECPQ
jgi:3-oxoacyl-(acyl-carrier-protein) synthase